MPILETTAYTSNILHETSSDLLFLSSVQKVQRSKNSCVQLRRFHLACFGPYCYSLSLHKSEAQNPQIDAQKSCRNQRDRQLICELQEAKLRIARLESVLEESWRNLNVKNKYIEECTKLIEENTHEIELLQSALFILKDDSSSSDKRLEMLEEEVLLLWDASRKNNFDLHTLESKAQDAENRLEVVKSRAQMMADIVTEQWIQVQQLEQALQIAQMRTLKVKRQLRFTKCTFLKFINNLFGDHLEQLMGMLDPYLHDERSAPDSYLSQVWHQLKRIFSAAKYHHHQLQGYVKQEMERNEFTAAFANNEVVFFMAGIRYDHLPDTECLDVPRVIIQLRRGNFHFKEGSNG